MKISVIHDYADGLRQTRAFRRLEGHEVLVHNDAYLDPARVVEQLKGCDAALLTQGRPGFAAVDVYEEEPVLGGRHPLLELKNVICTPHLGYNERSNLESIYEAAVDNLLAYAAGKPVNVVNPEALSR